MREHGLGAWPMARDLCVGRGGAVTCAASGRRCALGPLIRSIGEAPRVKN